MGLDITAYEYATITLPHERESENGNACYEAVEYGGQGHVYAFVYEGMEQSLRGLTPNRCYATSGKSIRFRAGSYSGYNAFREALSQAALGVAPRQVWGQLDTYRDEPFFELIHFADNEGTIGPEAAADLAADFANERDAVLPALDGWDEIYDQWQQAFELAAGTGIVEFH